MTDKIIDKPLIIAPPPLIFCACLVTGISLQYLFPLHLIDLALWVRIIPGVFLLAFSGLVAFSSFRILNKNATPYNPYRPTKKIVQEGPYARTRNPLYLSLVLLLIGFAFLGQSSYLFFLSIVLVMILDQGVIKPEEAYLEKKFGEEYIQYKLNVRRWL